MENANIGIFDDHSRIRKYLPVILEFEGHTVVINAASLEDATRQINEYQGQLHVALVDLRLGKQDPEAGNVIAELLRKKSNTVYIIGISAVKKAVEGADIDIPKDDIEKIVDHIKDL